MEINKKERKNLIRKISKASGIAQYALEEKMQDQQVIEASNNLDVLILLKKANDYNRWCQGQKTAEANAKLKEFLSVEKSEIYQAGQWLVNCFSKKGPERRDNLLEKDLVHKDDYNQTVSGLRETLKEYKEITDKKIDENISNIAQIEITNDKLRKQLGNIKEYIRRNHGKQEWERIAKYFNINEQ